MPLTNPIQFSCKFGKSQLFSRSTQTTIALPSTNPVQFSCKFGKSAAYFSSAQAAEKLRFSFHLQTLFSSAASLESHAVYFGSSYAAEKPRFSWHLQTLFSSVVNLDTHSQVREVQLPQQNKSTLHLCAGRRTRPI